jgi:hypothetical protein
MRKWHTLISREPLARVRWMSRILLRLCVCASSALTFAACSSGEKISAPIDPSVALHQAGRISAIQQFANAQGTYCDDLNTLPCFGPYNDLGIGWILGNGASAGPAPFGRDPVFYNLDIGGVNSRWWAKNRLSPRFPRYAIRGRVHESRLNDGRRRLRISLEAENTFSFVGREHYDENGQYLSFDPLIGADFFEYPGVDSATPDQTPRIADVTAELDLVLPAGFVGMPDLAQVVYEPTAGMEIRRMDVTVAFFGRLRNAYDDIPANARVRVRIRDDWSHKLSPLGPYTPPRIVVTRVRDHGQGTSEDGQ